MSEERIHAENLRRFAKAVLEAAGAKPEQAKLVAKILVWGDAIGRTNQGVWRLRVLTERLVCGVVNTKCNTRIMRKSAALGLVDGDRGLGHYVGSIAMSHAIDLATDSDIGAVGVCDSNFFGAGRYFVQMSAE